MGKGKEILTTAHKHLAGLAADLPQVKRVLDAPAGTGFISQQMRNLGYEVIAGDIAPQVFKPRDIPVLKINLNQTFPFADNTFDLAVCREGIEHVENQFFVLREFGRIVRDKGFLLISTPNILCLRSRLANLLVGGGKLLALPPHEGWIDKDGAGHINMRNYYILRLALIHAGFRIARIATQKYTKTSLALAPLVPLIALFTWCALHRKRKIVPMETRREIVQHVLSPSLLFGKKLIILAQRAI